MCAPPRREARRYGPATLPVSTTAPKECDQNQSLALSRGFRLSVLLAMEAKESARRAGCEKCAKRGYPLRCRDSWGRAARSVTFRSTSGASDGKTPTEAMLCGASPETSAGSPESTSEEP
jgi:hypothetical protein